MKAYKGFNKDMKCRGFQFKEGETYHEDAAKLCSSGFHACEDPIDCFGYYAPSESVYHEVELDEVSDERRDDTKVVAKTIKVGAEIGIPGIVAAHIEYIKNLCASPDAPKEKHSVKDQGAASATGCRGAASATGDQGAASATGRASVATAAGRFGKVRGALWCAIFAVERGEFDGETYPIIAAVAAIVDGEKIKADTWYTVKDGEFVEVDL